MNECFGCCGWAVTQFAPELKKTQFTIWQYLFVFLNIENVSQKWREKPDRPSMAFMTLPEILECSLVIRDMFLFYCLRRVLSNVRAPKTSVSQRWAFPYDGRPLRWAFPYDGRSPRWASPYTMDVRVSLRSRWAFPYDGRPLRWAFPYDRHPLRWTSASP